MASTEMSIDIPPPEASVQSRLRDFSGWRSLNDSIMGGSSQAGCRVGPEGLFLEGELVEEGGGFVSCRSPKLMPALDLSAYQGLQLEVDGEGRTLKLAIASRDGVFGLTERIPGGLRWVAPIPTNASGTTIIEIPFASLQATVRAKPAPLPFRSLRFDPSGISQLQLLHSKFNESGELNPGFRPGQIRILLRCIRAVH